MKSQDTNYLHDETYKISSLMEVKSNQASNIRLHLSINLHMQKNLSFRIKCKAMDTLEDPGSSILSYRSEVKRGVFYYVPKKSHIL